LCYFFFLTFPHSNVSKEECLFVLFLHLKCTTYARKLHLNLCSSVLNVYSNCPIGKREQCCLHCAHNFSSCFGLPGDRDRTAKHPSAHCASAAADAKTKVAQSLTLSSASPNAGLVADGGMLHMSNCAIVKQAWRQQLKRKQQQSLLAMASSHTRPVLLSRTIELFAPCHAPMQNRAGKKHQPEQRSWYADILTGAARAPLL